MTPVILIALIACLMRPISSNPLIQAEASRIVEGTVHTIQNGQLTLTPNEAGSDLAQLLVTMPEGVPHYFKEGAFVTLDVVEKVNGEFEFVKLMSLRKARPQNCYKRAHCSESMCNHLLHLDFM
jgi:hypothetical protein